MKNVIDRDKVLAKAVEDCYREMFAKAQPAADWDNLIAEYKAGKIDEEKDGPVYDRHYLSYHEYVYIIEKYIEAYHIKSEWKEDMEILEGYLQEGGSKDKYIDSHTDENGNYHPGYRSYEKVPPLKEQILTIMKDFDCSEAAANVGEQIYDKVMETISLCKNFYSFNVDEQKFRNTLAFGCSPTSNAETVKKWWKDHYDVDIEIEERNPLLLWEYDNYGDDMDAIMTEEEGENWKEIWDKKWEDEKKRKEKEYKAKYAQITENNKEDEQTN